MLKLRLKRTGRKAVTILPISYNGKYFYRRDGRPIEEAWIL